MAKSRKSGLSNAVHIRYGDSFHTNRTQTVKVKLNGTRKLAREAQQQRNQLAELDYENGEQLSGDDAGLEDESRDKAMFMGHIGGKKDVVGGILNQLKYRPPTKRTDDRPRSDRALLRAQAWADQMRLLADAYLDWKRTGPRSSGWYDSIAQESWNAHVFEFFSNEMKLFHSNDIDKYANETLVHHGCLGSAPLFPTVAFSFQTLEAYQQLHLTSPQLTFRAYVKTLCNLQQIPFRPVLAEQFHITFDAYLELLSQVDGRD